MINFFPLIFYHLLIKLKDKIPKEKKNKIFVKKKKESGLGDNHYKNCRHFSNNGIC
jgi:hypothetical protein